MDIKYEFKEKFQIVTNKMNSIDFDDLWLKFHRYDIALFDDKNICYKGKLSIKTNEFLGNNSIKYKNEMIGIW